jgi:hypothetical protein
MTLADPKLISLTTIQVEKKIKDKKERVLDSQVTNITSGRHKQKGLNLLYFLQRFTFFNFFPTMTDNACNFL